MNLEFLGYPGKLLDRTVESSVVVTSFLGQVGTWLLNINRENILSFAKRKYPKFYRQLDGGDKRIMRAFLDPESVSNTFSLLGGVPWLGKDSEYRLNPGQIAQFGSDAFGAEATFDNSFVEKDERADEGKERWFFINGIATSREVARRNVRQLRAALGGRPFTLIHNPTQGLTNDLMESALQKFTNINTEPVARAFVEIGGALTDPKVTKVVVVAHSQGTIVMGDVLDALYVSIDRKYFDRTNMSDDDYDKFISSASGTVKAFEMKRVADQLQNAEGLMDKLELYMFANGASRMCYIDKDKKTPHIESYANEHDIVTRLGSLARDDFHKEDLIRIDGSLFTKDRYGHLFNAHYLSGFVKGEYKLKLRNEDAKQACIRGSIHDRVRGNPCFLHPKHVPGTGEPKLRGYLKQVASVQSNKGSKRKPLRVGLRARGPVRGRQAPRKAAD